MSVSEKIVFNGHELSASVPDSHVIDISVGSVSIEHNAQARVINAGSIFISKRDTTRTVTIQVELPLDRESALNNYNLLRAWAESNQPAPLYLPNCDKGYLQCILSAMGTMPVKSWYEPIELTFTAYDPYFYGETKTAECGSTFTIGGDALVDFTISMQNETALTDPAWTIDGVQKISFTGSIGAGLLLIDSSKGLATLAGQSVMTQLNYETRFTPLSTGNHTITGSGGTISWIERWR